MKHLNKSIHAFIIQNKKDVLVFIFFILLAPLFFYNLGNYSLVDFDEAWFAEVANNILKTGNPLVLTFNNQSFTEHPPLGFTLMAVSFLLFGLNEFAARLPEAVGGFLSLIVLYGIGKKLFNRTVGLSASLILVSCVWFVFRTRSGNLDTLFLFFYLLSFYCALKIRDHPRWVIYFVLSLTAVFLSKMLVGLSILIPIGIHFLIHQPRIAKKFIFVGILLFVILTLPWMIANTLTSTPQFLKHMVIVGLRPFGRITPNWLDLGSSLTLQYLHYGVRKWYYPFLIAFFGNLIFIKKYKHLIPVYGLVVFLLFGFLTNSKTEIWHLIPLYPFLALLTGFFVYQVSVRIIRVVKIVSNKKRSLFANIIVGALFGVFSFIQIYLFRNEVKLFDHDVSGLAYTAQAARHRPEKLYLNADYFLPSATFYSQKQVSMVIGQPYPKNTLVGFINDGPKPFLLLTEKWKLIVDKVDTQKYIPLKEHKEYILIYIP